ncbi:Ribokinase-like protein [Spinellus fusiger]|nr:Ribokinase-like protein [Spinellus fusiger]
MATMSKMLLVCVLLVALFQTVSASIYSQLQFMKIQSPKSGQDFRAGEKLIVKYVMQPLVFESTSMGKALSLDINFHSRTGNTKQQHLAIIHKSCPVAAKADKYVTYTKSWTIPSNVKPGSYAVDFVEQVQLRRSQITSTETFFTVSHICKSGETLSSNNYLVRAGGKGANQSVALAKVKGSAGSQVYHAGKIGADAEWNNGRAFIQVSQETGDNSIVLFPGTNGTYTVEDAAQVLSSFGPGDWIVQQNEISQGGDIMRLAASKVGLSILFNPAPLTRGILETFPFDKVTVLVVNEHEADSLYRELGEELPVLEGVDIAKALFHHFETMQVLIMTLGSKGVVALFREASVIRTIVVPGKIVSVKDTTGAGDTFVVSKRGLG